ncbi:transcriptional regulator [Amycolatopsis cynarae]|uniref:Transcriptional regulator n=1 Tax=Amycolatopsis cynarae TaxID=2995223 RepID=A0ABY7B9E0_9PSEU|nr:transcriptional regulator [Amycolatopsis sp. HUAS 11-8]WAL68985.1 transcriptional regulator [Amycolatopsis sp. HUAS 11-8]
MRAADLVAQTRRELKATANAISDHRFLTLLATGAVPHERLRALAAEQYGIVYSDRRSFAQLATRFPAGPAGDFFLGLAEGEGIALGRLGTLAAWLGLGEEDLRAHEPHPGAQAYPAYVAWLALNGSRSAVALAFVANLAAWGSNCGTVAAALRETYGASEEAVGFFEFFAAPAKGFEDHALAVIEQGLAEGDSPVLARRATRLLQSFELSFWDALAEGL